MEAAEGDAALRDNVLRWRQRVPMVVGAVRDEHGGIRRGSPRGSFTRAVALGVLFSPVEA